ncbi:MAG: hypothetical protein D6730_05630 [Bacteroidetes bacterium]|nr:MAG: hypothetical protein D6730_05630 [Bacteroidota bacterium]
MPVLQVGVEALLLKLVEHDGKKQGHFRAVGQVLGARAAPTVLVGEVQPHLSPKKELGGPAFYIRHAPKGREGHASRGFQQVGTGIHTVDVHLQISHAQAGVHIARQLAGFCFSQSVVLQAAIYRSFQHCWQRIISLKGEALLPQAAAGGSLHVFTGSLQAGQQFSSLGTGFGPECCLQLCLLQRIEQRLVGL